MDKFSEQRLDALFGEFLQPDCADVNDARTSKSYLDNVHEIGLMRKLGPILSELAPSEAGLRLETRGRVLLALGNMTETQCSMMRTRDLKNLAEAQMNLLRIEIQVIDRFIELNGRKPSSKELKIIMDALPVAVINKNFGTDFRLPEITGLDLTKIAA